MSRNKRFARGFIFFAVGVLLLIIALYSLGIFGTGGARKFSLEYGDDITPSNLYEYLSKEEVLEFLDNGTGILYLGYADSPWCKRVVQVLNDVAFEQGIKKIYYYDIKKDRNSLALKEDGTIMINANGTNFYKELLKELQGFTSKYILTDKDGKEVDTGEYRIYVPFVAFVKDGKVLYAHGDVVDSYTDTSTSLTQDQMDELYNIYKKGILLIQNTESN